MKNKVSAVKDAATAGNDDDGDWLVSLELTPVEDPPLLSPLIVCGIVKVATRFESIGSVIKYRL